MLFPIFLWAALLAALCFTANKALAKESTAAIVGLFTVVILCLAIGGGA